MCGDKTVLIDAISGRPVDLKDVWETPSEGGYTHIFVGEPKQNQTSVEATRNLARINRSICLPSWEDIIDYDYYAGDGGALKAFLSGVKSHLAEWISEDAVGSLDPLIFIPLKPPRSGKAPGADGRSYAKALVSSAGGDGIPTLKEFSEVHKIPLLYDKDGVLMRCSFNAIGRKSEEILDARREEDKQEGS